MSKEEKNYEISKENPKGFFLVNKYSDKLTDLQLCITLLFAMI